jgi:co-chaperonin GroES (HSP10)
MQSIPRSRYLDYFVNNLATISEQCEVIGNIIIVEKVKFPETKTAGGIIIGVESHRGQLNTLVSDRPAFYRVLHVGAGYFDADGNDIALNSKPGDIVLLASASVKLFSSFPLLGAYEADSIGITRDEDVQIRFKGQEAFERFAFGLDSHAKAQIPSGQDR